LLSLFAAAPVADEEVGAGEGDCDDEDYALCNAGFGAGEDRLALREATRPGLGKPGPFPGLVMGGVALKRERALSRVLRCQTRVGTTAHLSSVCRMRFTTRKST
jgi:hypothetical protein